MKWNHHENEARFKINTLTRVNASKRDIVEQVEEMGNFSIYFVINKPTKWSNA